jgi:peptide chain release factor 1
MSLPLAKLNTLVARMAEIDDRLSRPIDGETLVKLSRERAEIEPLNTAAAELRSAEAERQGLEALLADPEMAALADDERKKLDKRIAELTEKIRLLLLPKDAADEKRAH